MQEEFTYGAALELARARGADRVGERAAGARAALGAGIATAHSKVRARTRICGRAGGGRGGYASIRSVRGPGRRGGGKVPWGAATAPCAMRRMMGIEGRMPVRLLVSMPTAVSAACRRPATALPRGRLQLQAWDERTGAVTMARETTAATVARVSSALHKVGRGQGLPRSVCGAEGLGGRQGATPSIPPTTPYSPDHTPPCLSSHWPHPSPPRAPMPAPPGGRERARPDRRGRRVGRRRDGLAQGLGHAGLGAPARGDGGGAAGAGLGRQLANAAPGVAAGAGRAP